MGVSSSRASGLWLVALALAAFGCGRDAATPAAVYEVRGVVRQLPAAETPSPEIVIRHEAVPDFVDMGGRRVGMEAMTMPFPIRDASLLDGIAVGDEVLFRFRVDWDGSPPLEVVALEKLSS